MRLWVIDGGEALRKIIVQTSGQRALIQRCQEHKRRNVLGHLPEEAHASAKRAMNDARSAADADLAREQLARLASSLQAKHPEAADSLREGLEETLTVQALGIDGARHRTLRTIVHIDNLNGPLASDCRNVKRWGDGQTVLRWVASGYSAAAERMRNLRGCDRSGAPCQSPAGAAPTRRQRRRPQGRVAFPTKEPSPVTVLQRA
jgi:hypothetical protein